MPPTPTWYTAPTSLNLRARVRTPLRRVQLGRGWLRVRHRFIARGRLTGSARLRATGRQPLIAGYRVRTCAISATAVFRRQSRRWKYDVRGTSVRRRIVMSAVTRPEFGVVRWGRTVRLLVARSTSATSSARGLQQARFDDNSGWWHGSALPVMPDNSAIAASVTEHDCGCLEVVASADRIQRLAHRRNMLRRAAAAAADDGDAEPRHRPRVVRHDLRRAAVGDAVVLPARHAGVRLRHQHHALRLRLRHLRQDALDLRGPVAAVGADHAHAERRDRRQRGLRA